MKAITDIRFGDLRQEAGRWELAAFIHHDGPAGHRVHCHRVYFSDEVALGRTRPAMQIIGVRAVCMFVGRWVRSNDPHDDSVTEFFNQSDLDQLTEAERAALLEVDLHDEVSA